MRTDIECMVCFLQQALATARLSTNDPQLQRLIVSKTGELLSRLDMSISPPENAVAVYRQIADLSGVDDPYNELKDQSNTFALSLHDQVRERINNADDPLYAAVRFAIAGNIIDYGTCHEFNAMQTLSKCMEEELCINDYEQLNSDVKENEGRDILYLADNCGEIVFDSLLVEQLLQYNHNVTLVVRGKEILNDVTLKDAKHIGIEDQCTVITNGSSCPGTPLRSCGDDLKEAFNRADLIISKGQGNFETLSEEKSHGYFLLTVKCEVVARYIAALRSDSDVRLNGCGEMVLMKMEE